MGYDGKPIGLELTIVTVVLRYGVFPSEPNGTQCVGRNVPGLIDRGTRCTLSNHGHWIGLLC